MPFNVSGFFYENIMKAEIIAIGSELLLGQLVDTNSLTSQNGLQKMESNSSRLQRLGMISRDERGHQRGDHPISGCYHHGWYRPTEDDLTREPLQKFFKDL